MATWIRELVEAPPAEDVCLVPQIRQQAAETPTGRAVIAGPTVLTYGELDHRSNRVARRLHAIGVGIDTPVGLYLPRTPELAVAALGVWKAGGAYVPLDPAGPPERLAYILRDAQAPVVITTGPLANRLPGIGTALIDVNELDAAGSPDSPPSVAVSLDDLAYIIYTSGSTGTPKGVEITHRGLANLVAWHLKVFSVTPQDRASHVAGLGFDAAVWELWPYLAAGASVSMADEITRNSPELLRDWMLAQGITIGFVPTALAERMLFLEWPAKTAIRTILTGGDTLHHHPPAGLPFSVVNNYGPTESTVVATSATIPPQSGSRQLPPIGRPIAGTRIYLLDDGLKPVPAGAPGEICIESRGLARGYRNSPGLTAEKFIPNPFSRHPGSRLYRTGDLGEQLPDGLFTFLGRIDAQIKIRGYRIEPLEIVSALNRQSGVRDSAVIAREDAYGDKVLVAYLLTDPDFATAPNELRDQLRAYLPEYMLPAAFVTLPEFPRTAHGKLDYAALPEPDDDNTLVDEAVTLPRTPTEKRVAEIVGELLNVELIGVDDNFFLLGGHSLLGAQLIARLSRDFGVQIGLRTLFAAPTVEGLSLEIERLTAENGAGAEGT